MDLNCKGTMGEDKRLVLSTVPVQAGETADTLTVALPATIEPVAVWLSFEAPGAGTERRIVRSPLLDVTDGSISYRMPAGLLARRGRVYVQVNLLTRDGVVRSTFGPEASFECGEGIGNGVLDGMATLEQSLVEAGVAAGSAAAAATASRLALEQAARDGAFDGEKGDRGEKGEKGDKGDKGDRGEVGPQPPLTQTVTDAADSAPSNAAVADALSKKQDALTFDAAPTADSGNPVTSGGILTHVAEAVAGLTDGAPEDCGTLGRIATRIAAHERDYAALVSAVDEKAARSALDALAESSEQTAEALGASLAQKADRTDLETLRGSLAPIATSGVLADAEQDGAHRTVTDAQTAGWDAKQNALKAGTGIFLGEDGTISATGMEIPIDEALDAASVNPVQNKAVTAALDGKLDGGTFSAFAERMHPIATSGALADAEQDDGHRTVTDAQTAAWDEKYALPAAGIPTADLADGAVTAEKIADGAIVDAAVSPTAAIAQSKIDGLVSALSKKQDTISVTSPLTKSGAALGLTTTGTPTSGSGTPITAGGVYTALSKKQDTLSVTSPLTKSGSTLGLTTTDTPTSGSGTPITSGGVHGVLDRLFPKGTILFCAEDRSSPAEVVGGTWTKMSPQVALPKVGTSGDVPVKGTGWALGIDINDQKGRPMLQRYMGGNYGFTASKERAAKSCQVSVGVTASNAQFAEYSNYYVGLAADASNSGVVARLTYPEDASADSQHWHVNAWKRIS